MTGTLAATFWPSHRTASSSLSAATRNVILVIAGACLITLGAKIQVPFWPVPLTLQTLAVSVIAAAYGLRLGLLTVALYLGAGAMGLPVFAGALAGPAALIGPTAGFLAGFLVMAAIIGAAADRGLDRSFASLIGIMAIANVIVFIPGLLWLGTWTGYGAKLLETGFSPFIVGTAVKTLLGAAIMPAAWAILNRLRG
jgi:biotin transport system substrate-specific component